MKTIKIRDIVLGEGPPKICISLMGNSQKQVMQSANYAMELNADMYEWRADIFEAPNQRNIIEALAEIRNLLGNKPLIFTLRSMEEGGAGAISAEEYVQINGSVAASGLADIIDVEISKDYQTIAGIIAAAHRNNVYALLSAHYFKGMPPKDELLATLLMMQEYPADISKLAAMVESESDVLSIFEVALAMKDKYASRPFSIMGMGQKGILTRMAGGFFGSSFTFAKGKAASAPGQPEASDMRRLLKILRSDSGIKDVAAEGGK